MSCAVAGLLGVLCAVALGCGQSSSKLLSATDAQSLKQTLGQVREAVDAGDCATTTARLRRLKGLVGRLPGSVDRGLRQNLREEIDGKLAVQARAECAQSKTTTTPTITSVTPTTPTTTAPTTSTQTTPTATDTTPTDTTPTDTTSTPTDTTSVPTDTAPPLPPDGTGGAGTGTSSIG
jgi:cell division septation protein DedD